MVHGHLISVHQTVEKYYDFYLVPSVWPSHPCELQEPKRRRALKKDALRRRTKKTPEIQNHLRARLELLRSIHGSSYHHTGCLKKRTFYIAVLRNRLWCYVAFNCHLISSQLAVESHVPSMPVSQNSNSKVHFLWDTLYVFTYYTDKDLYLVIAAMLVTIYDQLNTILCLREASITKMKNLCGIDFLIGRFLLQSFFDYEDSERIENFLQVFVKKEVVTWLAGTSTTPPLPQFLKQTREKSPILWIVRFSSIKCQNKLFFFTALVSLVCVLDAFQQYRMYSNYPINTTAVVANLNI